MKGATTVVLAVLAVSTVLSSVEAAETIIRLQEDYCPDDENTCRLHHVAVFSRHVPFSPPSKEEVLRTSAFSVYTAAETEALLRAQASKDATAREALEATIRVLQDMVRQMATTQDQMAKQIQALEARSSGQ